MKQSACDATAIRERRTQGATLHETERVRRYNDLGVVSNVPAVASADVLV
jgi:hypothetical protein